MLIADQKKERSSLLQNALWLSYITITYNVLEGGISIWFGAADETLALFGFGVDSLAEVISGLGIAHFVHRLQKNGPETIDAFERTALLITGRALKLLAAGLTVSALYNIWVASVPETTLAGIVISVLSIATMWLLYSAKMKVGKALQSDPILSDASCTKTCFYLSFILLASSLIYELLQIPYIDAAGSLGIAWYAWKEGAESLQKARQRRWACHCDC